MLGAGGVHRGPQQHRAPIASMAKVMTAFLVLRRYPLPRDGDGFTMTVQQRDVDDYQRRGRAAASRRCRCGRRAADRASGARRAAAPVGQQHRDHARPPHVGHGAELRPAHEPAAAALHMAHADLHRPQRLRRRRPDRRRRDQLRIGARGDEPPTFRAMVRPQRYRIPVAGTIHNTDTLLGRDGFVGIKTGSMSRSGGCLMFRSRRVVARPGRRPVRRGDGPVRRRPDPGRAARGPAAGRPGGPAGGAGLSATRRGTRGASTRSRSR